MFFGVTKRIYFEPNCNRERVEDTTLYFCNNTLYSLYLIFYILPLSERRPFDLKRINIVAQKHKFKISAELF